MSPSEPERVDLSVVIPAYNERDSLPLLVDELRPVLASWGGSYEIVLVDDGSVDGTGVWIREQSLHDPCIRSVLLADRVGQSGALAAGFSRAKGDVIVTLDADLQNDPKDLPRVLEALEKADVVSGIRSTRADRWTRRVSSRIANAARRAVLGDAITDIGCSFKAYRREAVESLPWFTTAHRFLPALCQLRGARLAEVTVAHRPRRHGASKYGISNRLWRGLYDLWGVRWLRTRLIRYRVREGDS